MNVPAEVQRAQSRPHQSREKVHTDGNSRLLSFLFEIMKKMGFHVDIKSSAKSQAANDDENAKDLKQLSGEDLDYGKIPDHIVIDDQSEVTKAKSNRKQLYLQLF